MADDNLDYLPQRAVTTEDISSRKEGRLAAFRARAGRFALPAVLVLSVSAGLAGAGMAPKGTEAQSFTAAPAPATTMPERDASQVTRSLDRAITESVAPKLEAAAATPSEEPRAEEAAPASIPAAEPRVLTAFAASPAPSRTPSVAKASGRMFATETVNVRAEADASSARIGSVDRGDSVGVTGRTSNGFSQVVVNDRNGWVSTEFLSKNAPAAPAASSARAASSAPTRAASSAPARAASSAPARSGSRSSEAPKRAAAPAQATGNFAPLPGLQPNAQRAYQALRANFPAVTSYGGVRPDWDAEHPSGRAIDAMTSNQAVGDAVANWARANAGTFGITEVIWNQRIWTTQRASEGWRSMSDRGSATANHRDHVHISFS